jgi:Glycosyltransferase family 87
MVAVFAQSRNPAHANLLMKQWFDRHGFWVVLFFCCLAYYPRFVASSGAGMTLYPQAGRCILDSQILQKCAVLFTYPPAFAFIMIPLAPMPMWLRLMIWYVITVAAAVGSFKLSERLAARLFATPPSARELIWVRVIAVILSLKFVLAVLENEAYDAFSLVFIMLGLAGLADGREKAGGAALGFAAAVKATPLVFLPYLLVKKRFVAAAAFTAAMLLVSYLPDIFFSPAGAPAGYFRTWLHEVADASLYDPKAAKLVFWSGANLLNHSLRGAVSLQIDEVKHQELHHLVLYGLYLVFGVLVAAMIMLRKAERDQIALDGSILLIAMLMLSPMTSRSHYVVLILPYMTLTMVMLRDQVTRGLGIAVMATSFFFLTVTSNDAVGQTITDWAYSHSFLVIGALTLLIYFGVIVWNPAVLREAKPFIWCRPGAASAKPSPLADTPDESRT